jgi:hypothetical protein
VGIGKVNAGHADGGVGNNDLAHEMSFSRLLVRKVTVVRDRGTSVEVSNGVKNGDQVILNPPVDLVDGQAVNSHEVAAPNA